MTVKLTTYDSELLSQIVNFDFQGEQFNEPVNFGPANEDNTSNQIKRVENLINNWKDLSSASLEALGLLTERTQNIKITLSQDTIRNIKLFFPNIKEVTFQDYKKLIELQRNNYSCGNEILNEIDPNKLTPEELAKIVTNNMESPFSSKIDMDDFNEYLLILLLTLLLQILLEFLDFGGEIGVALKAILNTGLAVLQGILLEKAQSENMQKLKRQTSYAITNEYEQQTNKMFDENAALIGYTRLLYDNIDTAECMQYMLNSYGALSKQKNNANTENTVNIDFQSLGVDNTSTFSHSTIHNQNTFEKLLNCIGCDSRVFTSFDLMPNNSILSLFENEFESRRQQLNNFIQSLLSISVYEDLCLLLNLFKQQCIPDLSIIFSLLSSYFLALTSDNFNTNSNNNSQLIIQFIWPFIRNILFQLLAILQQYIDISLGVLDCLTNALNFNILQELGISTGGSARSPTDQFATLVKQMKSPFTAGLDKALVNNVPKLKPEQYWEDLGGKQFATTALKINSLYDIINTTDKNNIVPKYIKQGQDLLQELRKKAEATIDAIETETFSLLNEGLTGGQDYISDMFLNVFSTVQNVFEEQSNGKDFFTEFVNKKIKLIRLMSIMRALISGKSLRGFCEDDNTNPQAIKSFIQEFFNDKPIDIIIDDNTIVVKPQYTNQSVDVIINLLSDVNSRDLLLNTPTRVINIPDCLRNTQTTDVNQIQAWIKELDNE